MGWTISKRWPTSESFFIVATTLPITRPRNKADFSSLKPTEIAARETCAFARRR
jgi:hypothetical protein